MQIAILLFERLTALDAVGPYEILSRLPNAEIVFVGERLGPVRTEMGSLGLVVDAELSELPRPDVIVIPGGPGHTDLLRPGAVRDWLHVADETSTWTTAVCTGTLILAAAGLLRGRRATSHWLALDQLPAFGVEPTLQRVVFDGRYVTGAGISAGIDMALTLAGRIAGDQVGQMIQLGAEYDPQPPYDCGSPLKAPAEVADLVRARWQNLIESV